MTLGGAVRRLADYRLFVEGVLWVARAGSPWHDLPPEFGAWNTSHVRFVRWSDKQVRQKISSVLRDDADFEESFWTARLFARIDMPLVPLKKCAGDSTFSGWIDDKNSRLY